MLARFQGANLAVQVYTYDNATNNYSVPLNNTFVLPGTQLEGYWYRLFLGYCGNETQKVQSWIQLPDQSVQYAEVQAQHLVNAPYDVMYFYYGSDLVYTGLPTELFRLITYRFYPQPVFPVFYDNFSQLNSTMYS